MNTPTDDRQRILDATDIVRLIGEHLALKPKGREYVALCPFHDDHTPSMSVVPSKQIYKCFACGAGGNAIDFVINYHKMSFREALQHLAERSGIALTPRPARRGEGRAETEAPDEPASPRSALLGANATAATFFRTILAHPEHGGLARKALALRAVSREMIDLFQLGASPDKWDGLALTVAAKGLDASPFRAAGLLKARDGAAGGCYDTFRNRLIFPIHDQIGRVIAFGGRRLNDQDEPKYLNSAESPIFEKSSTLYGLHQAAQAIRSSRLAIVAEGYMDAIACHQAGFRNVVATLGTALTPGHARALRRLAQTVVLLFDGDEAGRRAAERAVEIFFAEPIDVRIATLSSVTDAKDPDELLKRDGGAAALRGALEKATDPLELLFSRVRASLEGQGLSARSRAVQEFISRLVDLGLDRVDKVRYQLILRRLAEITGVDWAAIAAEVSARRSRRRARPEGAREAPPADPPVFASANEHLLACVLCAPELLHSLDDEKRFLVAPAAYPAGFMRQIAQAVSTLAQSEREPSARNVLALLDDAGARRLAAHLIATLERHTEDDPERIRAHWRYHLDTARLEAARAGAPVALAPGAAPGDVAGALAATRARRAPFRRDPLAVPRPTA